jgi:hypothetical protein
MDKKYPAGKEGLKILFNLADKMKGSGKFDCLLPLSGGVDSSYMAHFVVRELGLRPLAFHFDNGWNTKEAENNITSMVKALDLEFIRYSLPRKEYNELNKAFLKASVREADIPNDVAMLCLFMETAEKNGIRYILNGHNFRTEGTCPPSWTRMDWKFINSVFKASTGRSLGSFPRFTIRRQLRWAFSGIKQVRPLYHLHTSRATMKQILTTEYNWNNYGNAHCENLYTKWVSCNLLPQKFSIDKRILHYSAQIRSGQISKDQAWHRLDMPINIPALNKEIYFGLYPSRLYDPYWFDGLMSNPVKTYKDFDNYDCTFKLLRPLFWILTKMGYFPQTFYDKYCKEV